MQKFDEENILKLIKEFRSSTAIQKYCSEYYTNRVKFLENETMKREFRITVVGEFSAGKSTFLNALIGKDILPHALTETTAAITYIHNVHANHPDVNKIVIHFNGAAKEDCVLDLSKNPNALKEYTTTQSSTVNVVQEIASVDIYIHFKNMEENIVFIDTPGLNGVADGHRELTLREIQNAHASIYLFHLRSLAKSDLEFVKILSRYQSAVLFVMNFIDEIKTAEGDTFEGKIEFLREQLKSEITASPDCRIKEIYTFGISALKALVYKDENVKRLYSSDIYNLTDAQRKALWELSRFGEFESFLWEYIAGGEKNRVFQEAVEQSFRGILMDLKEELMALSTLQNSNLQSGEVERIKERMAKCDEISQNNWVKVENFIDSRQFDLEQSFKKKIKGDLESVLNAIEKEIRTEDFDSLQAAYNTNKYGVLLQNQLSSIRARYLEYLQRILLEIYQSAILRAKQYNQTVSIDKDGVPVFHNEIKSDFGQREFEGKIQKLDEEKRMIAYDRKRMQQEQNKISLSIAEAAADIDRKNSDLQGISTQMTAEKKRLGSEPDVQIRYEDRTVLVERAAISIFRLFGSQYKEKTVSVRVEDTYERDRWRQKQSDIKLKYAYKQDQMEKELTGIKERKRQLENQSRINNDILNRTNTRISDIEKRILREKQDFEEIMSKAKSEYVSSEKTRLMNQMNEQLSSHNGKIYIKLREAVVENIASNIVVIKRETGDYYKKLHEKYKKELTFLLESEQKPMMQQEEQLREIKSAVSKIDGIVKQLNGKAGGRS